ncbi:fasciclin domain-containing protein [Methanolobus sp.]|uniref:fasciclin domain-containing protein n=1 Tax=Methanolobus sp. TaxID=1874737 RepID=UPI0025D9802D|nr:fasciclin domain-containing protein [Methanolobus sp.]
MKNSLLRIALIAAVMVLLSVGSASAACYLNDVQEDSIEYEGYLNVSLDVSTSAPYTAEMMLTDETLGFFPDATIETILLNIPADQIESVTDAEGNEWEINEVSEEANGFGAFNISIEPADDSEINSTTTVTINLVDSWDQSFPRNDAGYLIATDISNIGENAGDSAWVTLGFCEAPAPIVDEEEPVEEPPVEEPPVEEPPVEEPPVEETPVEEPPVEEQPAAETVCYLNVVQEDKSAYEGQLNATLVIDNETENTAEIELANETLEDFQDAQIGKLLLNVPADQIENVTDAEGNELEFTETGEETDDNPFGNFITMITVMMSDEMEHDFGEFTTEITVSETENMTGPITIAFTEEWNGALSPNEEGYVIAADVQNIGEMGDDNAWITLGFCEASEATEQMNIVETATEAGSFSTLGMALDEANLTETLSGEGPFTVFAPTDEAFEALPEGTLDELLQDEDALTAVLTYHVVSGEYNASDIADMESLPTVQGEDINVTVENENVMVNDANVTTADIEASNGIIHVIDSVMLPPSMLEGTNETETEDMNDTITPDDDNVIIVN